MDTVDTFIRITESGTIPIMALSLAMVWKSYQKIIETTIKNQQDEINFLRKEISENKKSPDNFDVTGD